MEKVVGRGGVWLVRGGKEGSSQTSNIICRAKLVDMLLISTSYSESGLVSAMTLSTDLTLKPTGSSASDSSGTRPCRKLAGNSGQLPRQVAPAIDRGSRPSIGHTTRNGSNISNPAGTRSSMPSCVLTTREAF